MACLILGHAQSSLRNYVICVRYGDDNNSCLLQRPATKFMTRLLYHETALDATTSFELLSSFHTHIHFLHEIINLWRNAETKQGVQLDCISSYLQGACHALSMSLQSIF